MKVLLTGANGYIGKRLLNILVKLDHKVICAVRDANRFNHPLKSDKNVTVVEVDFLKPETYAQLPTEIDGAYYLLHSLSSNSKDFEEMEDRMAKNVKDYFDRISVKHVIYLGGISNQEELSPHLASRLQTENILREGNFNFTALRAGIILGSGSASFEIMRDLVEKLPVMVAPKWLKTKSQPIAVRNVLEYLSRCLCCEYTFNQNFDIGGKEVLSYEEMLLKFAKKRGLKRYIITVPVLTPKLSSYWLYFVTSTTFSLARNLVDSMNIEVICRDNDLAEVLDIELYTFDEAIERAFERVKQNFIASSWKDSLVSGRLSSDFEKYAEVPEYGCYKDRKKRKIEYIDSVMNNIWSLGGAQGWFYGNWLWKLRGYLDKVAGGVGLRRGRTNTQDINTGDSLDFWRVLLADRENRRLLLFAEMKLPGEAWLEFKIDEQNILYQTATFRPRGLYGRLYWLLVLPFHYFVFNGMINGIATQYNKTKH